MSQCCFLALNNCLYRFLFSVQDVFAFEWALLDTHIQCSAAIWHADSTNKGRVYISLFCVSVCVWFCQVSNKCVFNKGSFSAGEEFTILENYSSAVCTFTHSHLHPALLNINCINVNITLSAWLKGSRTEQKNAQSLLAEWLRFYTALCGKMHTSPQLYTVNGFKEPRLKWGDDIVINKYCNKEQTA